jgi:hypothetical protein
MKTIKLLALLIFCSLMSFGQEPKDSTVVSNKPEIDIEINYDMIMRFHLAEFDSTKNFNYMLSNYLKPDELKPEE